MFTMSLHLRSGNLKFRYKYYSTLDFRADLYTNSSALLHTFNEIDLVRVNTLFNCAFRSFWMKKVLTCVQRNPFYFVIDFQ